MHRRAIAPPPLVTRNDTWKTQLRSRDNSAIAIADRRRRHERADAFSDCLDPKKT